MKTPDLLRRIPSVSELLESPQVRMLVSRVNQSSVVAGVRAVLHDLREEIQRLPTKGDPASLVDLAERVARRVLLGEGEASRPVINATGVLLHPEYGQPPLADAALEAMIGAAPGYATRGDRGDARSTEAARLIAALSGAEKAIVLGSYSGAVLAALSVTAGSRSVVVSRGDLIEDESGERFDRLAAASGVTLREVGTANVTTLGDYERALAGDVGAVVSIHRSSFQTLGHARSCDVVALANLVEDHKVPLVRIVRSAALVDLAPFGLIDLPRLSSDLTDEADLVITSGDALLGGPPCGMILGRANLIASIATHPLTQAMLAERTTLAALAATLRLYRDAKGDSPAVPLLQLIATPLENLQHRAKRLAEQLAGPALAAEAVASRSSLTSLALPGEQLPSWSIALSPLDGTPQRLLRDLQRGTPAIAAKVEGERVLVDMRTVFPRQDAELALAIEAAVRRPNSGPGESPVPGPAPGTDAPPPETAV